MAMSLEAAITVPVCIITFSLALSQAVPAYIQANTASALSAEAVKVRCANNSIFEDISVEYRSSYMTAVSTSPDGIIDLYRLGKDILRPLGDLCDNEVSTDEESGK